MTTRWRMARAASLFALALAAALLVAAPQAMAVVFDLTADWSYTANPHGVWAYEWGANPLPAVYRGSDPWSAPQLSWGDLPGWFRSNGSEQFGHDWIEGDIITHTDGGGGTQTSASWTSPYGGTLSISGAVWPCRDIGRTVHWTLVVDGVAITDGEVGSGDPYSRANPMDFALGSGGAGVLTGIAIARGERVELRLLALGLGDYAGVRMVLNVTPTNPADVGGSEVAVGDGVSVAPNPTTGGCWIRGGALRGNSGGAGASVLIHDVAGRLVRRLAWGSEGWSHTFCVWDGKDDAGRAVSAGVYVVSLAGVDGRIPPGNAARVTVCR